jgi:flagellar hook-length control protein FliK
VNGRQEVTIELSRSVLEGLRVKVSADAAGRITADFLASSDQVRSALDARTPELLALLRSRGIELAELRTSVATDSGGRNDAQREQAAAAVQGVSDRTGASERTSEATSEADVLNEGSTYRA